MVWVQCMYLSTNKQTNKQTNKPNKTKQNKTKQNKQTNKHVGKVGIVAARLEYLHVLVSLVEDFRLLQERKHVSYSLELELAVLNLENATHTADGSEIQPTN